MRAHSAHTKGTKNASMTVRRLLREYFCADPDADHQVTIMTTAPLPLGEIGLRRITVVIDVVGEPVK